MNKVYGHNFSKMDLGEVGITPGLKKILDAAYIENVKDLLLYMRNKGRVTYLPGVTVEDETRILNKLREYGVNNPYNNLTTVEWISVYHPEVMDEFIEYQLDRIIEPSLIVYRKLFIIYDDERLCTIIKRNGINTVGELLVYRMMWTYFQHLDGIGKNYAIAIMEGLDNVGLMRPYETMPEDIQIYIRREVTLKTIEEVLHSPRITSAAKSKGFTRLGDICTYIAHEHNLRMWFELIGCVDAKPEYETLRMIFDNVCLADSNLPGGVR